MSTITERLLADAPAFHGDLTHSLVPEALALIERLVQPGDRTLETGAGFSTVTFAAAQADHVTIVHDEQEPQRIRAYCDAIGVSLSNVEFIVGFTERVLPTLDLGALDLVLLDGSHAFPGAFMDWFYTADALKIGGTLVLDDVHLWTGHALSSFLRADPAWDHLDELHGRTAIFRKIRPAQLSRDWSEQPYVVRKSLGLMGIPIKLRQALSMLRNGQSKTLLREARARLH